MTTNALEYSYRYASASCVSEAPSPDRQQVILAPDRRFSFSAGITRPDLFADSLLCLSSVVRSNFAYPSPALLDPVVTCAPDSVRLEGFSGCCGVYASVNLLDSMLNNTDVEYGTTNVDLNDTFRNGLASLRQSRSLDLQVKHTEIAVSDGSNKIIEKKVKLPLRWLRGFCEVQTMLSRVEPVLACSSRDTRKFIHSLPRNAARQRPIWAMPSGKGMRASTQESDRAVPIVGTDRLRLLDPLLRAYEGKVSIGRVPGQATSSWFCDFGCLQFLLFLSPGIYRGFSGEGQVLTQLADASWQNAIDQVRSSLDWEQPLDTDSLSAVLNLPPDEVGNALAALATRGVLGFDLHRQQYFYRVLPFEAELVESLQPRLLAARKIVKDQLIAADTAATDSHRWIVRGGEFDYIVELGEENSNCTCVWYNTHRNSRGPCKHILAAMIFTGKEV